MFRDAIHDCFLVASDAMAVSAIRHSFRLACFCVCACVCALLVQNWASMHACNVCCCCSMTLPHSLLLQQLLLGRNTRRLTLRPSASSSILCSRSDHQRADTHTHTHTPTQTHTHTQTHTDKHTNRQTHTHIQTDKQTNTHTHTHTHTSGWAYVPCKCLLRCGHGGAALGCAAQCTGSERTGGGAHRMQCTHRDD